MIVKMSKATILCIRDDVTSTLNALLKIGALHLEPITIPRSRDLDKSAGKLKQAKSIQVILDSYKKQSGDNSNVIADKKTFIDDINDLLQKKKTLIMEADNLNKEKQLIEPYGDFDPSLAIQASEQGLHIKLFHDSAKKTVVPPEATHLFHLGKHSGEQYFVLIGQSDFKYDAKELPLPKRSLSEVNSEINSVKDELQDIEKQLISLSTRTDIVNNVITDLESEMDLIEAREGMGSSERLAYIQGFYPENQTELLRETARKSGWGLIINEPASDDKVPTLIKSPAWVKPIKSLFTMLDILPGYKEVDIRAVFFIFFAMFFAILVADGGYGIVFLVLTIILRKKFKKAPPEPFVLGAVLSICAIIWGVITGSYFGIEELPAPLSGLTIPWLKSEEHMMMFAFLAGAIHLTIAHAWRAILTINSTRALAQVGWICITWCAFFLSRNLILGFELPSWFMGLGITGLILVAVFMTPFKLLKKEWADHVMLPFDVVGGFADLVSYVRLFAVGSASLAVATAFNELAIGEGIHSVGSGIAAVVILFLGHSLNIILCLMSILVHGVRLNTLEFSGHIGLEWSGLKYKPFAEQSLGNTEQ